MADGISITAGSGTTVLTDDTGAGGHAQIVKLAISTDGSGTLIAADASGIQVQGAAADGAAVTGKPVLIAGQDGTNAQSISVDTTGRPVVVGAAAAGAAISGNPLLMGGSDGTNARALKCDATGDLQIVGDFAHDAAESSSNPVKVGMRAIAHGANPTAVAANDRTDWFANRHGVPWVMGGHPNIVTSRVTYSASAQTDVAIGPGTVAPGLKVVVTQIQVTVSNPTTATPSVIVGFGATNTPTTTGVVLAHPGIPGGGGVSRGDGSGILGIGADGEELRITAAAATGGVLDCVVSYYTVES